jgi:hypothetical protein
LEAGVAGPGARRERSRQMRPTGVLPRETERQAFVEKVRTFRETLPETEQRMLDAMVKAAFGPVAEAE